MPATATALSVLIFLLPGFVSLKASESLVVRRARSDLHMVIEALVFSFLDAVLFLAAVGLIGLLLPRVGGLAANPFFEVTGANTLAFSRFVSLSGVLLMMVAVVVGLTHGAVSHRGSYHRLMRDRLRLTRLTGRLGVWTDAFSEQPAPWVRIGMPDGSIVQGWPRYYSENPEIAEVYLRDVTVYGPAPDDLRRMDGFLLTRNYNIQWIEFYRTMRGDSHARQDRADLRSPP